jgi:hypothetical protein
VESKQAGQDTFTGPPYASSIALSAARLTTRGYVSGRFCWRACTGVTSQRWVSATDQ